MKRQPPVASTSGQQALSPLRQARRDAGATLEQVCAALDRATGTGSSGVHPSMLSGWERGIHVTSAHYRGMLCDYYGLPEAHLFAHQAPATTDHHGPRLLHSHPELQAAMLQVVTGAQHYLAVAGSRSRDSTYLQAIEELLARRPRLVHYRILFGPPRHRVLVDHLHRLLELRDPADRSHGFKTMHIAVITTDVPEKFFVASDHDAVVPIPSLTSADGFDSGVALGATGARLVDHARQLYAAGHKVETAAELDTTTP